MSRPCLFLLKVAPRGVIFLFIEEAKLIAREYKNLELIPIKGHSKYPPLKGWNKNNPGDQWGELFEGDWNLAFRANQNHSPIDCDNRKSAENIAKHLASLGIHETPTTLTSRGCHFHINIKNRPDRQKITLKKNAGDGHICLGNSAYVLAPPSDANDHIYTLQGATPATLATSMPQINWGDLSELFNKPSKRGFTDWPFRPVRFNDPKKAIEFLIEAGKPDNKGNRSEMEMKAVYHCISCGLSFDETKDFFDFWQPGHYMEKAPDIRDIYIADSWSNAISRCLSMPKREMILESINNLASFSFKNKNDIYIAETILKIAWQFNSFNVALPQATIAEHLKELNVSQQQVHHSFKRLKDTNLIKATSSYFINKAAIYYNINPLISPPPLYV